MENRKQTEEDDTRKLTLVVVYMSMVVLVIFGFVPPA